MDCTHFLPNHRLILDATCGTHANNQLQPYLSRKQLRMFQPRISFNSPNPQTNPSNPPGCRIHLPNPRPPWRRAPPSEVTQFPGGVHRLGRQPREGPQLPGAPQPQLLLEPLAELETLRLEAVARAIFTEDGLTPETW